MGIDIKTCSKCDKPFPLSEFYKRSKGNGLYSACKTCHKQQSVIWQAAHSDKVRNIKRLSARRHKDTRKNYRLKKAYGISLEEYQEKVHLQHNLCDICKKPMSSPQVDHNHRTNKLRALLCKSCNQGLGMFQDNIDVVQEAAIYLTRWV